jgi:Xaa-Pro aminopeptidase
MSSQLPQRSTDHCHASQQRLREALTKLKADRAILVAAENVQWLTGFRPHPLMRAMAILEVDSDCTLIAPGVERLTHLPNGVAHRNVECDPFHSLPTTHQSKWQIARPFG